MDLTLGFAKNTFRKDTFSTSQIVFASYVVGVMLCVTLERGDTRSKICAERNNWREVVHVTTFPNGTIRMRWGIPHMSRRFW